MTLESSSKSSEGENPHVTAIEIAQTHAAELMRHAASTARSHRTVLSLKRAR